MKEKDCKILSSGHDSAIANMISLQLWSLAQDRACQTTTNKHEGVHETLPLSVELLITGRF